MTSNKVKITILVDNHAGPWLKPEHGLSIFIEAFDQRILFDTGQGNVLQNNAKALGVDLTAIDRLVISHGHYDHTGGLAAILSAREMDVYCHPATTQPRYSIGFGLPRPINMPHDALTALNKVSEKRLHWVTTATYLSENIGLTGPIPRHTDYEDNGGPFFLDPQGERSDPVSDDQALWITTDQGLIVCVGCAHAGVINTLNYVMQLSGDTRIRAVIGGFHLNNANQQRLTETTFALKKISPDMVIPCHCTGDTAVETLRCTLGEIVRHCSSGMTYPF